MRWRWSRPGRSGWCASSTTYSASSSLPSRRYCGRSRVLAAITIVYGSVRALFQDDLKRRLAFSTVSQVSYIALGIAIVGPTATIGGIVHLVHQGLMKITLFFCAGNFARNAWASTRSARWTAIGRRMPWTTGGFHPAAFGMIGVPPMAGFISKWYLGLGGLEAGADWVLLVLAISSLLNAAYFLPILRTAWFDPPPEGTGEDRPAAPVREAPLALLLPPLATAAAALVWGLFASMPGTPLDWVQLIAARKYMP